VTLNHASGRKTPCAAASLDGKKRMKRQGAVIVASPSRLLLPRSRLRLQIFFFKLLLLIPVSVFLASHRGLPLLATITFFFGWNSIFASLAALVQRQRCGAAFLTAWDEAAAFLALALLARVLDASLA
jgi:hypothetical protein